MSKQILKRSATTNSSRRTDTKRSARLFAALGDETRLQLLSRLGAGAPQSIKQLTVDLPITRQAVTKHLRILEEADFVTQQSRGRERLFAARRAGLDEAQAALKVIAQQWGDALQRLRNFVESNSL